MIYGISKECTQEHILYSRIDDEHVKKCHYNKNGQRVKEKEINIRSINQNRRSHRNTEDFFEDMICNHGYHECH